MSSRRICGSGHGPRYTPSMRILLLVPFLSSCLLLPEEPSRANPSSPLQLGVGMGILPGHDLPEARGALAPEAIKAVIVAHRQDARSCYEATLQRDTSLAGRIVMTWTIGPSGAVTRVEVKSSTMKDPGVQDCLVGRIKAWLFPAPADGDDVEVTYPFAFTPVG